MPAGAASALLLQMALAGGIPFYDASVYSDARGVARPPDAPTAEIGVNPQLGLALVGPRLELGASYLPRLFMQDQKPGVQVLHNGALTARWRVDPIWRVAGAAYGSYGIIDLLQSPLVGPAQSNQFAPRVTQLQYLGANASLRVEGKIAAPYAVYAGLSAFDDGGLGVDAERSLPRQLGARLTGGLSWDASRNDVLGSETIASFTQFTKGQKDTIVALSGRWRHVVRPDPEERDVDPRDIVVGEPARRKDAGEIWMALGVAGDAHHEVGDPTRYAPSLTAEAGARGPLGVSRLEGAASVRATPQADRFTTALYDRADANASLTWRAHPDWTFDTSATGGMVVDGPQRGQRMATGDARVKWTGIGSCEVVMGVRAWWQTALVGISPAFHEWSSFLGFTYHRHGSF